MPRAVTTELTSFLTFPAQFVRVEPIHGTNIAYASLRECKHWPQPCSTYAGLNTVLACTWESFTLCGKKMKTSMTDLLEALKKARSLSHSIVGSPY